jgi:hypothetical protein
LGHTATKKLSFGQVLLFLHIILKYQAVVALNRIATLPVDTLKAVCVATVILSVLLLYHAAHHKGQTEA